MLIGLGHDIQLISQLEDAQALRQPGLFFTERETSRFSAQPQPIESLAATFSAKEALFKALPKVEGYFWTDIEVIHDERGRPGYFLQGVLRQWFLRSDWRAYLSISHSGDYVSAVALIASGGSF